jgi:hypothetical protein
VGEFLAALIRLESDDTFRELIKESALNLIHKKYSWEGKLQILDDVLNGRI